MKKRMSIVLALTLAFALCLSFVPASAAGTDGAAEEVIYAKLDASGAVESAYAVVALNGSAGEEASHYGEYTAVENLTDTSALTYEDGRVSAALPESGRLYYKGTLESVELPWNIELGYSLDGQAVEPSELGGRSGDLEMTIDVSPNEAAPGDFAGRQMLQITVTLDASLCTEIEAEGATIANAGGDKTLAFTVLPGAEAGYTISAEVRDFEMAGLTIAGVDYDIASAMGDTTEITDGLGQLTDAISQLNSGTGGAGLRGAQPGLRGLAVRLRAEHALRRVGADSLRLRADIHRPGTDNGRALRAGRRRRGRRQRQPGPQRARPAAGGAQPDSRRPGPGGGRARRPLRGLWRRLSGAAAGRGGHTGAQRGRGGHSGPDGPGA